MTRSAGPEAGARGGWTLRNSGGIAYYALAGFPNLLIAFITRSGGVSRDKWETLNLSFDVGDSETHVRKNWDMLRAALRLPSIVTLRQTHSDIVLPIAYDKTPPETLQGDACFTGLRGLGLGVRVADCLPVYVFSADGRCAGVAHCGWRGTVARIAERTARQMSRRFAVPLSDLHFALGPTICPACYPVGEDVAQEFSARFPAGGRFLARAQPGHHHAQFSLDLRAANRWLLTGTGMKCAGSLDRCTFEGASEFYSARRDGTTGRNLALVALRTPTATRQEPD